LQTNLEAFAVRDALLENSLANQFVPYLAEAVCVEVTVLEDGFVLVKVLEVADHRILA